MTFSDFVGHDDAKLALILNAIDPNCGGVLFAGEKGSGKSTLSRLFKEILPEAFPFIDLPLNITEDALMGGVNIEDTIKTGRRVFQPGVLGRADGGVVYIDDVNLLSPDIASLVLEAMGRGENIVEREGIALRHPSRFILVASMNQEEGVLSPHLLDRFGMMVLWEGLKEGPQRIEVIKKAAPDVFGRSLSREDRCLRDKIRSCRSVLKDTVIPAETRDYIAQLCIENNIPGSRGDIYLMYAARAHAAYCGRKEVTRDDVDAVAPLVLAHRKRVSQQQQQQQMEQQTEQQEGRQEHGEQTGSDGQEKQHGSQSSGKHREPDGSRPDQAGMDGPDDGGRQQMESNPKEEVFETGGLFKTKRIILRKDRVNRSVSGRRTKTGSRDKSGRYVKSVQRKKDDIAIDATLRAAAPHQKARGRTEVILIRDDDLRFKQREKKMGHLVVFVVDGSGSMGARRRMVETKGAVQSLLMDCYQKRDRVSMIVFRKDRAEVILPPTSSVENASRRLREIPVGGKTPLAAGLLEAYRLIKRATVKSPEMRAIGVLITDGRANQGISGAPIGEEVRKMAQLLSELSLTDYIVVDTEDKSGFIKTDLALQIASQLGADYHTIEGLRADCLVEMVQMKKVGVFGF
ncbi:VWA domain-containing protein [Dissulfurimicrobium hydrothermale]|uniref:VWA domain-containing protein n=1 Tax=Dissulfurimicrobium hydrothermale TaxID=1750598 RepID=UPI001EDBA5FA|nr:VWA domain-containing protein [Dissulfurimicrobium hydrothermale]UKL13397.1 VWA domain-containing protein [Dissulfurimicrobium hydrothermale]